MAKFGPRKIPTELRLLKGSKLPKNQHEPQSPAASLKAPEILQGDALKMWNRRAPQLAAMKLLRDADRETLLRYCIAWELYLIAYRTVSETGLSGEIDSGRRVAAPENALIRGYHADLLSIEREFGCTPSARTGLSIAENEREGNELRSFLEGSA